MPIADRFASERPADGFDDDAGPLVVAQTFAAIGRTLAVHDDTSAALTALTDLTTRLVPGARWVSITRGVGDRFTTLAPTGEVATAADELQYRTGTGPCIDAVVTEAVLESADLAADDRWARFGPRSPGTSGSAACCRCG